MVVVVVVEGSDDENEDGRYKCGDGEHEDACWAEGSAGVNVKEAGSCCCLLILLIVAVAAPAAAAAVAVIVDDSRHLAAEWWKGWRLLSEAEGTLASPLVEEVFHERGSPPLPRGGCFSSCEAGGSGSCGSRDGGCRFVADGGGGSWWW